jgi:hypothetical protein
MPLPAGDYLAPNPWLQASSHSRLNKLSVGQAVKLLLAFASTEIPGFSFLEIHDQDFYSLQDMYMFRNGASSSTKEGSVFLCRRYVSCTVVSHEHIRVVTASRSLWTLCILCHCTILSNIYAKYKDLSRQCSLMEQVMP